MVPGGSRPSTCDRRIESTADRNESPARRSLSTIEVRQLQANALRLRETEIAALCDKVLGARPRGRVATKH